MHMRSGDVEVRKTLPYFHSPSVLRQYSDIEEATFDMFTSDINLYISSWGYLL
jgi:hypothetical protein